MPPVKTLFFGEIDGAASRMFKRLATLEKDKGPFDVAFCAGRFFPAGGEDEPCADSMSPYLDGQTPAAVPTYIIGGSGQGAADGLRRLAISQPNITYLGRAGVTRINELTIAYLDGVYNEAAYNSSPDLQGNCCPYYTAVDVELLKRALQTLEGEVDVLLTCEWPRGLISSSIAGQTPNGFDPSTSGSDSVAEIASLARPRYHIAAGQPFFFARAPYMNKDLGAGPRATRFVGLAPFTSTTKQKALHALALIPADTLDVETLQQEPEGATPSPYESATIGKRAQREEDREGGQEWRWNMNAGKRQRTGGPPGTAGKPAAWESWGADNIVVDNRKSVYVANLNYSSTMDDVATFFRAAGLRVTDVRWKHREDGRPHGWCHVQFHTVANANAAVGLNGQLMMGRPLTVAPATPTLGQAAAGAVGKPVEKCWFCLSTTAADVALVASVGEEVYMALDKGPISPQHVLLVPIEHYPSLAAVHASCYAEMERYLSALRACYAAGGKELVAFERHLRLSNMGGNHCHVNCLAISPIAARKARATFLQHCKDAGFRLVELVPGTDQAALQDEVGSGEYFLGMLPDGSRIVCTIPKGLRCPITLGREILAELAGNPERADWKKCKAETEDEEIALTEAFKEAFKQYDIMA